MIKCHLIMEFTVYRHTWLRGGVDGNGNEVDPSLLDNGQRCCLGFLGLACGLAYDLGPYRRDPDKYLQSAGEPEDCKNIAWPASILSYDEGHGTNTGLTQRIIEVNDNRRLSETAREAELTGLFAQGGLTVRFED